MYPMLKQKLLDYARTHVGGKTLKDKDLAGLVDKSIELNVPVKHKCALILLDFDKPPLCCCGNALEFTGPAKSYYSTPFGGWKRFCCVGCMHSSQDMVDARRKTNLERYGEQSYAKTKDFRDKAALPWSDEKKRKYNENYRKTALEKYGVEHYSSTPEYLEKRNNTCLEKYGVENVYQSDTHKAKIKQTSVDKHGWYGWFSSEVGIDYVRNNNPQKDINVREKGAITRLSRHFRDVDKEFIDIIISRDKDRFRAYIENVAKLVGEYRFSIAEHIGVSYATMCRYFRIYGMRDVYNLVNRNTSRQELEILAFVKEHRPDAYSCDRLILDGKEIDIVSPSDKLGIEVNGIWAHSEYRGNKHKSYHLEKTEKCESKGIQLLHIMETEWEDPTKKEIWKSIILNRMGLTKGRIYARKCTIAEVSAPDARNFLSTNHLAGFRPASKHLGLYYDNVLVSVMSFGKSIYHTNETWEVVRFASLINMVVVGAMSKLLKHSNYDNLICYADRRFSSTLNNSYSKIFKNVSTTEPNWYGFYHGEYALSHRLSYTKDKVKAMLGELYDDKLNVFDNMINTGYDRIWDCGNMKFSM